MASEEKLLDHLIRLLIVDDHPLFRKGVRFYLEAIPEFQVVGEVSNGAAALELLPEVGADIILLDLQMPEMDGVAATQRIKETWPEIKILILTSFNSWDKVQAALKAGANGYVLKDARPEELAAAVKAVAVGGNYLGAAAAEAMLNRVGAESQEDPASGGLSEPLTEREMEVLRLIGKGMGNREIATALFLSEKTVKTHVANILQKLRVKSRTLAALYAAQHHLI